MRVQRTKGLARVVKKRKLDTDQHPIVDGERSGSQLSRLQDSREHVTEPKMAMLALLRIEGPGGFATMDFIQM
jgi:hypothetical protein